MLNKVIVRFACPSCGLLRTSLLSTQKYRTFLTRTNVLFRIKRFKSGGQTSEKTATKNGFSQLARLFSLAKPVRWRIAAGVCLLVVSSGVTISVPYFIGQMMDSMTTSPFGLKPPKTVDDEDEADQKEKAEKIMKKMKQLFIPLAVIFCVGGLANCGRYYFMQTSSQIITARLRTKVFRSIICQEMAFFDKSKTGELVNRLANDATRVSYSISMNISDGLRGAVSFSGGLGMMIYTSPQMSVFSLAGLMLVAYAVVYGRIQKRLAEKMNDALANATEVAEERFGNILTVRSFVGEKKATNEYKLKIEKVLEIARQEALAAGVFFGLNACSGYLFLFGMLYAGGSFVLSGAITIGQLTSFMFYQLYAVVSIGSLGSVYSELMKGLGSSTRLFELMDRVPHIPLEGGLQPSFFFGDIRFKNVQFTFPSRENESHVLKNVNLSIQAGTVTALVGPSGSGKSTVGSLLLRLYDPDSGKIMMDGRDIKEYDPSWYKKHIGTVSQDPILFSCTIRENIAYGAENPDSVSDAQIEEAARKANALEFIQSFPEQFNAMVGERGSSMSGGQRQRIAIARALLTKPKLLILDEATSALDAESEYLVRKALENLLKEHKQTVLIIAHRLSTIKNADQIAVLSDGTVAELGTYPQLMAIENGIFKQLVEKQTDISSEDSF